MDPRPGAQRSDDSVMADWRDVQKEIQKAPYLPKSREQIQRPGRLIHPLCEVVAGRQRRRDFCRAHLSITAQVLGVLPFEILAALFRVGFTPEMTVRRGLLILRLAEGQRHSNGTRTA